MVELIILILFIVGCCVAVSLALSAWLIWSIWSIWIVLIVGALVFYGF